MKTLTRRLFVPVVRVPIADDVRGISGASGQFRTCSKFLGLGSLG